MAPAPRSKPSKRTYKATMTATRQNQRVSIVGSLCLNQCGGFRARHFFNLGPVFDFAIDEEEPEDGKQSVHAHETEQSEPGIARSNARRNAVNRAHDAVNEPGLAAEFGGHPPGGVGDVREGSAEHQEPKHPAGFEQFLEP